MIRRFAPVLLLFGWVVQAAASPVVVYKPKNDEVFDPHQVYKIKPEVTLHQQGPEEQLAQQQAGEPVVLVRADPVYAPYLKWKNVMGCVRISFDVLANGTTDNLAIESSWPKGIFDPLGIKAVFETKYRPADKAQRSERLFVFEKELPPEVGSHVAVSPKARIEKACRAGAHPAPKTLRAEVAE